MLSRVKCMLPCSTVGSPSDSWVSCFSAYCAHLRRRRLWCALRRPNDCRPRLIRCVMYVVYSSVVCCYFTSRRFGIMSLTRRRSNARRLPTVGPVSSVICLCPDACHVLPSARWAEFAHSPTATASSTVGIFDQVASTKKLFILVSLFRNILD